MTPEVTVVEFGIGNVLSVMRALEHCGARVVLAETPSQIKRASKLVLPGVGAFENGMYELKARGFVDPIKEHARMEKPLLGICLGMQLLLNKSDEFGETTGLGIIPGKVIAIPKVGTNGIPHKIPHIGWNELVFPSLASSWKDSILANVNVNTPMYFIHSYTAVPVSEEDRLANAYYDGCLIAAGLRSGNTYGCQFHPEKSGQEGLKILQSFLEL